MADNNSFPIRFTPDIEVSDADLQKAANSILKGVESKVRNGVIEIAITPTMDNSTIRRLVSDLSNSLGKGIKLTVDTGDAGKKLNSLKNQFESLQKTTQKYKKNSGQVLKDYTKGASLPNEKEIREKSTTTYENDLTGQMRSRITKGEFNKLTAETQLYSERQKSAVASLQKIYNTDDWEKDSNLVDRASKLNTYLQESGKAIDEYNKRFKTAPEIVNNLDTEAKSLTEKINLKLADTVNNLKQDIASTQKIVDSIQAEAAKLFSESFNEVLNKKETTSTKRPSDPNTAKKRAQEIYSKIDNGKDLTEDEKNEFDEVVSYLQKNSRNTPQKFIRLKDSLNASVPEITEADVSETVGIIQDFGKRTITNSKESQAVVKEINSLLKKSSFDDLEQKQYDGLIESLGAYRYKKTTTGRVNIADRFLERYSGNAADITSGKFFKPDSPVIDETKTTEKITLTPDTSKVDSSLAELKNKTVNVNLNTTNDSGLQTTLNDIKELESKDKSIQFSVSLNKDPDFDSVLSEIKQLQNSEKVFTYTASLTEDEGFNTVISNINKLQSEDKNIAFHMDVPDESKITNLINQLKTTEEGIKPLKVALDINDTDVEKIKQLLDNLRSQDNQTIKFRFDLNTSEIEQAIASLSSLTTGNKDIILTANTDALLKDLVAVEEIINELKQNSKIDLSLKTGEAFSSESLSRIESMVTAIQKVADAGRSYEVQMSESFGLSGQSISEVNSLLQSLNASLAESVGLARQFKIKTNSSNARTSASTLGDNNQSNVKTANESARTTYRSDTERIAQEKIKVQRQVDDLVSSINKYEKNKISTVDSGLFLESYREKYEDLVSDLGSIKEKAKAGELITQDDVDSCSKRVQEIQKELYNFTNKTNQRKYHKTNAQGNAITEGFTDVFDERAISAHLKNSDKNISKVVDVSMRQNGNAAKAIVKTTSGDYESYAVKFDRANGIIRKSLTGTNVQGGVLSQTFSNLGMQLQKLTRYLVSMGAIQYVWQGFKEGIQSVKDMQDALVELRKVTDESEDRYIKTMEANFDVGKSIGQDAIALTNSTADYARLGYSIDESEELAKQTGVLMNVSEFENMSDATDAMISMLQGFGKSANEAESVIDIMNAVGNNLPISTADLAISLQRSASALSAGGNDIYKSAALTAAGKQHCLKYMETYFYRTYLNALIA